MAAACPKTSADVLANYKATHNPGTLTTASGRPIGEKSTVMTVGPRGPMLMQDVVYMDEMGHFDRERVPERVVHAKGGGAKGYFECTSNISNYTKACIFGEAGKKTPLFIRFSTVAGESGSADTVRDPRGFAIKFYTEDGNWDLVGNNTPIFFIRDPILFPNFIHALKRNPKTHQRDPNAFWDFCTLRPESVHQIMFLCSDRGLPDGFRFMNGYGSHTFKFINQMGKSVWCKFHLKPKQGIKNLAPEKAAVLAGSSPDYALKDLYDAIEAGDCPEWTFFIQVMSEEEAEQVVFNPFDVTKVWPHEQFPLTEVGRVVLNENPANYFAETEQVAFSPANVIPGIDFSPDKMLQGRLFSYTDTHFHRLGANYRHIPVNCPYRAQVRNTQRDGLMCVDGNQGEAPVHHPNSFNGPVERRETKEHAFYIQGLVDRHEDGEEDNYSQPRQFWSKVLDEDARKRLATNMVSQISGCLPEIQERVIEVFGRVNPDFKVMLREQLEASQKLMEKMEAKEKGGKNQESALERFGDAIKDALTPSSH